MSTGPLLPVHEALLQAVTRATLAPSIHNAQPWRFVLGPDSIDVRLDPAQRLPLEDPTGRQSAISCGAAIFALRVSLAAAGLDVATVLCPDAADPDLVATLSVVSPGAEIDIDAQRLNDAADQRHSNRRPFGSEAVPPGVIDRLSYVAELEGAWLQPICKETDGALVVLAGQQADALLNGSQASRCELRAWTTGEANADSAQTMLSLGTAGDRPADWLRAGQALERVLLEFTCAGYVANIYFQVTEELSTRQHMDDSLRGSGHPHLMLHVGQADAPPATRRSA